MLTYVQRRDIAMDQETAADYSARAREETRPDLAVEHQEFAAHYAARARTALTAGQSEK